MITRTRYLELNCSKLSSQVNYIMEAVDTEIQEDNDLQDFILRYNDTDITISVDSATAYLLTNDHNYAEKYAEAVLNDEVPAACSEIEYLLEDGTPTSPNSDIEQLVIVTNEKEDSESNSNSNSSAVWTYAHLELLLNIRLSMDLKFKYPHARKGVLWDELAEKFSSLTTINATGSTCYSKWRNMLKTFKRVLKNVKTTGKAANWPMYDVLFEVYGDLTSNENVEGQKYDCESSVKDDDSILWHSADVEVLVSSRLDMQELFMQPNRNTDDLWTAIAQKIKSVAPLPHPGVACKTKWFYLVDTYKKKLSSFELGEDPYKWPYFKMFHDIYKGFDLDKNGEDIKRKRTDIWSECVTTLLIQTRTSMDDQFKSHKVPKSTLWTRIAMSINSEFDMYVTGSECYSKWQLLVETYRKLSYKIHETDDRSSSWPYYNFMKTHFAESCRTSSATWNLESNISDEDDDDDDDVDDIGDSQKVWPSFDLELLVSSRFEMHDAFSATDSNRDELWSKISQNIKYSSSFKHPGRTCKIKWLQLLSTYKKFLVCNSNVEDPYKWCYFRIFHEKYKGFFSNNKDDQSRYKPFIWSQENTILLIKTRVDMDKRFRCQNVKRSTLWSRVAAIMNSTHDIKVTGMDCDIKWRNLMGTYRKIYSRINEIGENTSSWPYYNLIDKMYLIRESDIQKNSKEELSTSPTNDDHDDSLVPQKFWNSEVVNVLVQERAEMNENFKNPVCKGYELWNNIARKLNQRFPNEKLTGMECNTKWRNLKRTYRVLLSKMKANQNTIPIWPYFTTFHDLFGVAENITAVEMEVSFNEDHGYVFEVVPSSVAVTNDKQSKVLKDPEIETLDERSQTPDISIVSESVHKMPVSQKIQKQPREPSPGPSYLNSGVKEEKWLKLMLLDWKRERKERWEEKKKIERDKITAINNLTKAIISLGKN